MKLIERFSVAKIIKEDNVNKYYIIDVIEYGSSYKLTKRYGRLGKKPIIIEKEMTSLSDALHLARSKYEEEIHKGYKDISLEEIMTSDGSFMI